MVMKSLVVGGAIVVGSACFLAAQQSANQGSSGVGSTQNDPTQGASSGTQTGTPTVTPQAGVVQQQAVDPANPNGRQTAPAGHDLDHYITDCLINGNQAEIALARIAQQRATDPQVKQFAEKMIHEHSMFMNKLRGENGNAANGAADQSRQIQPVANEQPAAQQPNNAQPNNRQVNGAESTARTAAGEEGVTVRTPGAQVTVGQGNANDNNHRGAARQFLEVEKEVHQQCLQSKTRELSQKEGAQFDRCYMNSQVAAHMGMADHLIVFSRYASPALQAELNEGLQTTQQHLAHAKQIAERLDGATPRSADNKQNPSQQ
jgi:predicted outer membrane protein